MIDELRFLNFNDLKKEYQMQGENQIDKKIIMGEKYKLLGNTYYGEMVCSDMLI